MKTIGFTGTRGGLTTAQHAALYQLLRRHNPYTLVHGGARGADKAADLIAVDMRLTRIVWPTRETEAVWAATARQQPRTLRVMAPLPPLLRNHHIVDDCEFLIACPAGVTEELRSGTWATVRYARACGRQIVMVWP